MAAILEKLTLYMQYPFVRYALTVGMLISLCSSLLGVTLPRNPALCLRMREINECACRHHRDGCARVGQRGGCGSDKAQQHDGLLRGLCHDE